MTTITPIATSTNVISSNQTDSATQQTESADTDTSTTPLPEDSSIESTNTATPDTVEISTRAQKIQKLNEEFFSAGPQNFKITTAFIDRLEEYGFLSANEADQLDGIAAVTSSDDEGTSTVGELSIFIDSFIDSVEEIAPDSSLIAILQQAQTVLDNFNDPTINGLTVDIPTVIEQLKNHSDAATDQLQEANQESFDQLMLALSIANVLTPGQNTTAEIDRYLAISEL